MKVKELIVALQACPQDYDAYLEYDDFEWGLSSDLIEVVKSEPEYQLVVVTRLKT